VPHLMHAQAVSRDSLAEIRRLVLALRPAELTAAPLADAIGRVTKQWSAANAVDAEFDAESLPSLHPDADVIFLRAAQEALSNVARHANARHVRVTLGCVDQLVQLAVEDDGCGFDHADTPGRERLGLTGMRERLRPMGGHLLIESHAGTGTSLTVVLPLAAAVAGSAS
ncbi:MAG: ATP-binding protein, partial [Gemmatimonadaceae bacterium]